MNIIQQLLCDPDNVAQCDRFVIANAMERMIKEVESQCVYTVQDYDTIEYAGTNLEDAEKKVRGNGCVVVWNNGKVIAYVEYKRNEWCWRNV